jgi:hypothetical protein
VILKEKRNQSKVKEKGIKAYHYEIYQITKEDKKNATKELQNKTFNKM